MIFSFRFILFAICILYMNFLYAASWLTDFEQAKANAFRTNRPIFILFTQSDTSPSCVRMHSLIFDAKKFLDYADKRLILMKVDFPAASSTQSQSVRSQNKNLLLKFKISTFPTFFLLNSQGSIITDFVAEAGSRSKYNSIITDMLTREAPDRFAAYVEPFVKKFHGPIDKKEIILRNNYPFYFMQSFPRRQYTRQTRPNKQPAQKATAQLSNNKNKSDQLYPTDKNSSNLPDPQDDKTATAVESTNENGPNIILDQPSVNPNRSIPLASSQTGEKDGPTIILTQEATPDDSPIFIVPETSDDKIAGPTIIIPEE